MFTRGLLMVLTCVSTLAVLSSASQAGDRIYRFVDARGVVHFTNVPTDPRYVLVKPNRARNSEQNPHSHRYDELIVEAAHRHGVPPALVKAVIRRESNFNPSAQSRKGAEGLMQLMPETARAMGVTNSFHVEQNVNAGTAYLKQLIDRYGNWRYALAAYNAGPSAVESYQGIPPFPETQEYVRRVLQYYQAYDVDFM